MLFDHNFTVLTIVIIKLAAEDVQRVVLAPMKGVEDKPNARVITRPATMRKSTVGTLFD